MMGGAEPSGNDTRIDTGSDTGNDSNGNASSRGTGNFEELLIQHREQLKHMLQ